ncbi:putative baseplate assembly protein [Neptunomonas qingdaonensis]|uniref:Putative baseplate assembly protein n=1 Tax=Neptunomonas qingdaonensis TaxID=1045558 RepID=A0A1I2PED6_9GAMM|nr:putative baseplate assembly protein [Neptunomonas qingdaonensis]SFG14444.1 putative baseplate assembly protein [Neptunomonas qingdaonensis]
MNGHNSTKPGCDCCSGVDAVTPRRIDNPPGLTQFPYRIGRHSDFFESIQSRLSSVDNPALAALTTRESSDFTLAIGDALACSLDVLSFYTERYAHEHYLRTATERLSVGAMARLIGYELAPGVAASTHLAFTLQSVPGAPAKPIEIPMGTRVQSVPGQDEQAQTFETVAPAAARAQWNAIKLQQSEFQLPVYGDTQLWLEGIDSGLAVGDLILIVGAEHEAAPQDERWDVRVITRLNIDMPRQLTCVGWQQALGHSRPFVLPASEGVQIYTFRTRAAVFGHTAPDWRALSDESKADYIGLLSPDELIRPADIEEWPDYSVLAPLYPERRSGSSDISKVHRAATVEEIVAAANGAAQGAAAMAMHKAANAGSGVVMAGGQIAETAMNMARESAEGLSEVANLAVNEVTQRARTLIHSQGQSLQALQLTAEDLARVIARDFFQQGIADSLAALPAKVQDLTAQGLTDRIAIAEAVLDELIDSLQLGNENYPVDPLPGLEQIWSDAVVEAIGTIETVKGDLGSLLDNIVGSFLGAEKALEEAKTRVGDISLSNGLSTTSSIMAEVIEAFKTVIGTEFSGENFQKIINFDGVFESVQEWTEGLFTVGSDVVLLLKQMQDEIANSTGVMFSKLGQDVAKMAQEAQSGIAGTAALLNPAEALAALNDAASEMREQSRHAGVAALSAAATADVAALVTTAVTIAQNLPPPFPAATPESIAEVARHFAALGVARAGGSSASEAAAGSVLAKIETLMPTSLQAPVEFAEQLLPLLGDVDDLLSSPRSGAESAYQRIVADVERALVGKVVNVSTRRAPLVRSPDRIDLSRVHDSVVAGSWALLSVPNSTELYRINSAVAASRAEYLMSGQTTRVELEGELTNGRLPAEFEHAVRSLSVHVDSEQLALAEIPLSYPVYGERIALAGHVEGLLAGQPLALSGKRQRVIMLRGISNRILSCDDGSQRLLVEGDSLLMMKAPERLTGETTNYLPPQDFARLLGKRNIWFRLTLQDRDGCVGQVALRGSEIALEKAYKDDALVSEIIFLVDTDEAITQDRNRSYLKLTASTQQCYERISTRINANVAPATQGETVANTILGSGNGSVFNQHFTLTQTPLTFVSANTPTGRTSTLQVRVGDVLWTEVPMLHGAESDARVYEINQDDTAHTTLQFGDGIEGARLPSGESNLRVSYRKGIGLAGNVDAGTLTTLLSRPLGVSEAVNPVAATGGEDAEPLSRARDNAPLTVLTLDRVVSVEDYANFARAFAGIDKAHALWVPAGPARGMFLSIAGVDGAMVPETSQTFKNLLGALQIYGDPQIPLRMTNYIDTRFRCRLSIKVQDDYEIDPVIDNVDAAIRSHFGFAQRRFGQTVSADEVVAVAQAVRGIAGVHITQLYRAGDPPPANVIPRLFARLPVASLSSLPLAAELLTVDENAIQLEVLP